MKVFVSSTYIDLVDHRKVVADALERMNLSIGRMEVLGAKPEEPKTVCLSLIDDCQLFVGIYAHRYGFTPSGESKSITESEYDYAKIHNKKMFCFIVDDNEPWVPKFIERDVGAQKLVSFKSRVKAELTVDFFTKPEDLAYKVSTSLSSYLTSKKNEPRRIENIMAPTYFHGVYARSANGDALCLGWVKPEKCDALKLYQAFSPGIDPSNRNTFDKVEYYNSIGLQAGVRDQGRKHYYRISSVYENIEGAASEEICIDTARTPIDNYMSLSPKLTPVNISAKYEGNLLVVEWENPSEIDLKYVVYIFLKNGSSKRVLSNTCKYTDEMVAQYSPVVQISVAPLLYGNEGYSTNRIDVC